MISLIAVDTIIRDGRIVDPMNNLDMTGDVAIKNGKILEVGEDLQSKYNAANKFDAQGCVITPGLIDCHVHCYQYATELGINPDDSCLARGVTTIIDAGSSGAGTFPGLRKFIAESSKTRVLSFLHIAAHGLAAFLDILVNGGAGTFAGLRKFIAESSKTAVLAFLHIAAHGLAASGCSGFGSGGECDSLNQLNVKQCVNCINKNRDMIVGVKIRLSKDVANDGIYEEEAYRRALAAAQEANVPLMAHHTFSTIPHGTNDSTALSCPGSLRPGDIYTHSLHGFPSSTVDPESMSVRQDVIDAKQRGVLFDIGHGQGSFCWTVAEQWIREGLFPDIISTDLHTGTCFGPAYDLPTVMTKMLSLGMSLTDVIKATTSVPAKAIKMDHLIGSLTVGHPADVTVLKLEPCDFEMEDCQSQVRRVKNRLIPVAVWKDGSPYEVKLPDKFPNMETIRHQAKFWSDLVVKDKTQPTFS